MQTIQFADLLTSGAFYTCEQSAQNPSGGCNGNLAWTPFMTSVNSMLNMFTNSAQSVIFDPSTQTFVNTSVPVAADPAYQCQAPCPAGSFSNSGYMTFADQCQWCPSGTYSSYSASTSCTPCPNGGTTSSTGNTNSNACSGGSPSSPTGGSDGSNDGDADASFLASDNADDVKTNKSSLPAYGIALIALASIFVAAVAVVAGVKLMRHRRHQDVELSESA